jgi:hypothetical protein
MEVSFKSYKSKLLFYSILLITLTLLSLCTPTSRLGYFFLAVPIVTMLFFVLAIYTIINKFKWGNFNSHLLYSLIIITLSVVMQILILRYQIKASEKSGDEIIYALNNYFVKNNKYPNDIYELEPEFINKIPKTKMVLQMEAFHYTHKQNQSFNLSFDIDLFDSYYKTDKSNRWISID